MDCNISCRHICSLVVYSVDPLIFVSLHVWNMQLSMHNFVQKGVGDTESFSTTLTC